MVAHNKMTSESHERSLAELTNLKLQIEQINSEKAEADRALAGRQSEWRRKEDQFLEMIQKERHLKEVAEADLEQFIANHSSSRRDNKELEELEKENIALKDKVRRQEAYLKRKLEQEKVMRDRSSKLNKPGKVSVRTGGGSSTASELTTPLRDRTVMRSNTPQLPLMTTTTTSLSIPPKQRSSSPSPTSEKNNHFGFSSSTRKGGSIPAQQRKTRSRLQAPTAVTASTASVVSDVSSLLMDDWDGQSASQYSV